MPSALNSIYVSIVTGIGTLKLVGLKVTTVVTEDVAISRIVSDVVRDRNTDDTED